MASRKKFKVASMPDGPELAEHDPFTCTNNESLNLEKSLNSIALLLLTLTDPYGEDKDLDSRIAKGFAIALNRLADGVKNCTG